MKELVQGLEDLEIRGRAETIHTSALLRSTRILRRVFENSGDLLSLRLQWKTIHQHWCEELLNGDDDDDDDDDDDNSSSSSNYRSNNNNSSYIFDLVNLYK